MLPHRAFPCDECPFRSDNRDNPAAKFPAERWRALVVTVRDPRDGREPALDAPLFGCHKGAPGSGLDLACAGWLATVGRDHLRVRLALATGQLPHQALQQDATWPPLYRSWAETAAAQTSDDTNAST